MGINRKSPILFGLSRRAVIELSFGSRGHSAADDLLFGTCGLALLTLAPSETALGERLK